MAETVIAERGGAPPGPSALILTPESPRPVTEIGRILSFHLGLHPTDAIARVRYGGGILISGVETAAALDLSRKLAERGVACRTIEAALLSRLPRAVRARALELDPEQSAELHPEIAEKLKPGDLRAILPGGRRIDFPRESLQGLHLYALAAEKGPEPPEEPDAPSRGILPVPRLRTRSRSSSGLTPQEVEDQRNARWFARHHHEVGEPVQISQRGMKLRDALREIGEPSPTLHLTLHCGSPFGPVRLAAAELDHAGLGVEKLDHSFDNFLLLLSKLRELAPGIHGGAELTSFLAELDPSGLLYFKKEEAQNRDRWLQLWILIRELEAGTAPPREERR